MARKLSTSGWARSIELRFFFTLQMVQISGKAVRQINDGPKIAAKLLIETEHVFSPQTSEIAFPAYINHSISFDVAVAFPIDLRYIAIDSQFAVVGD